MLLKATGQLKQTKGERSRLLFKCIQDEEMS